MRFATYLCSSVVLKHMCDPEGGGGGGAGVRTPWKIAKNIGFPSDTGTDPLKITKLPSRHSMLGHQRPAGETPFKWRFAGGPLMARL